MLIPFLNLPSHAGTTASRQIVVIIGNHDSNLTRTLTRAIHEVQTFALEMGFEEQLREMDRANQRLLEIFANPEPVLFTMPSDPTPPAKVALAPWDLAAQARLGRAPFPAATTTKQRMTVFRCRSGRAPAPRFASYRRARRRAGR